MLLQNAVQVDAHSDTRNPSSADAGLTTAVIRWATQKMTSRTYHDSLQNKPHPQGNCVILDRVDARQTVQLKHRGFFFGSYSATMSKSTATLQTLYRWLTVVSTVLYSYTILDEPASAVQQPGVVPAVRDTFVSRCVFRHNTGAARREADVPRSLRPPVETPGAGPSRLR